jgi:carbamoyltransferase
VLTPAGRRRPRELSASRLLSPYMMLAFPTVPSRRDELAAAIHPRDFATPAHIVEPAWNPGYHAVLSEFERLSGVGAVLNAPLALHGEPIVCSAADAVDVFERSGLPHLALDRWIISRK